MSYKKVEEEFDKKNFYPLSRDSWGQEEMAAAMGVLVSGKYTMGSQVAKFEEEFSEKIGKKHSIMTNSGSSANLIMMAAFKRKYKIPDGSVVLVPAVSWSTTYFPIIQNNMIPHLVDVNYTLNINENICEDLIKNGYKAVAILGVNLLGFGISPKLKKLCDDHNIHLLEDSCESLGGKFPNGKFHGTLGTMGTYSFFFSHHLQTMEGGMVVTDDDELADLLRAYRAHGWIRDLKTNLVFDKNSVDEFQRKFTFIVPGYCVRPLEISAAIGRQQLKKLDHFTHRRRVNLVKFLHRWEPSKIKTHFFIQQPETDDFVSPFGFAMISKTISRNLIIEKLAKEGIETRPIVTGNFAKQPIFTELLLEKKASTTLDDLYIANYLHDRGFFVGNDDRDLTKQIDKLFDVLESLC